MKLQQLSLFLENRPGQIKVPCRILADAGINIFTLSLADTQTFGILRLIVKDAPRAKQVLEAAGCVVNVAEVLAIDVADRPGGLADLLETFDTAGVAIEYMYAFSDRKANTAVMIIRVENPDTALPTLQKAGINVIARSELFQRAQ